LFFKKSCDWSDLAQQLTQADKKLSPIEFGIFQGFQSIKYNLDLE